jgi:hypothetical protein
MGKSKFCDLCCEGLRLFYCSCEQIFICQNCKEKHENHVIFEAEMKEVDFSILSERTINEDVVKHLEKLLNIVVEFKQRLENADPENPPKELLNIKITYTYLREFLNVLFRNQSLDSLVYLPDRENNIYCFNIRTRETSDTNITIDGNIKGPFWVLEWKNFLVILGGIRGNSISDKIYLADKTSGDVTTFSSLPSGLSGGFTPVIYEDFLYIIGGRVKKGMKKIPTKEVLVLNLNTGRFEMSLKMCNERTEVSACVANNILFVISPDCPGTIEMKNLGDNSDFSNYETNDEVLKGAACLYSYQNVLFLFKDYKIFKCRDIENLEFEVETVVEEILDSEGSEKWNNIRPPYVDNNFTAFFNERLFFLFNQRNDVETFSYR